MSHTIDTQQRDAGLRAFSKHDFDRSFSLLQPCAVAGDARAQMLLARMYYVGNGVPQDHTQYLYWLEQAANNGEKSARARLKRVNKQL